MSAVCPAPAATSHVNELAMRVRDVRDAGLRLVEPLSAEDCAAQSMPDASPAKWHLAHTSWFFETFLLRRFKPGFEAIDPRFDRLFNSYYESLGERHPRPQRGVLTRPSMAEVLAYRRRIDTELVDWIDAGITDEARRLVELGLHHERQHQELLLTDIKHLLFQNPLRPIYRNRPSIGTAAPQQAETSKAEAFQAVAEGKVLVGHGGKGFAFDNESPRHGHWLMPYGIAKRPVDNACYREFILDDGYRRHELWLSDGWQVVQQAGWQRPLYWSPGLDAEFTLAGERAIDDAAPVCHLSYYEADAYARWRGARLPTEAEWEAVAAAQRVAGNFVESGALHPLAGSAEGVGQLFGDVWEWTGSAYLPYPGFRAAAGAVGEYNGKFMCNQMVLRGGSCVSAADHLRATYRNFFYPDARWQFSGLRLAVDPPAKN